MSSLWVTSVFVWTMSPAGCLRRWNAKTSKRIKAGTNRISRKTLIKVISPVHVFESSVIGQTNNDKRKVRNHRIALIRPKVRLPKLCPMKVKKLAKSNPRKLVKAAKPMTCTQRLGINMTTFQVSPNKLTTRKVTAKPPFFMQKSKAGISRVDAGSRIVRICVYKLSTSASPRSCNISLMVPK